MDATGTAEANMQATIDVAVDAAVEATAAALLETPEISEEEMAGAIDEAVDEVAVATEQASTATNQAAADGTITAEELEELEAYVLAAEEAIYYTEALIDAYYGLYGELAVETLELLLAIEDDLATTAQSLEEIVVILDQGAEAASAAAVQMQTAAQTAYSTAAEVQAQSQNWQAQVQAVVENRVNGALSVPPNQVAGNPQEAIESVFAYIDTVRNSIADGVISQVELANISQFGANASASLGAHGGQQLQNLGGSINDITAQIARGQMNQIQGGLGALESKLPSRPSRP
jgi:hypothetical protein